MGAFNISRSGGGAGGGGEENDPRQTTDSILYTLVNLMHNPAEQTEDMDTWSRR